MDLNELQIKK